MAAGKKTGEAQKLSKKDYHARLPRLREQLVRLQVQLKEASFPVILIIAGDDSSGKGDLINNFSGWVDPRGVEVFSFQPPTDDERERPVMWRYWRSLPPRGRLGVYAGSWHTEVLRRAYEGSLSPTGFRAALQRINHFEKTLVADGALIVKCWLHLSKNDQRDRLKKFESDPRTAWRVTPEDWRHHRDYVKLDRLGQQLRRGTQQPGAGWNIIDASDERARDLTVTDLLIERFRLHAAAMAKLAGAKKTKATAALKPSGQRRLQALPLDQKLSEAAYEEKRDKWLGRLNALVRRTKEEKRAIVFVFEGWDAAGKGGAIRRLTSAIDARDYRVVPIAKPTDEEKAHHYLWRFWRQLPRAGLITLFDRSWYGRVLVERLEGFARDDEWRRAYGEINDFESELAERGVIVIKFWLHISKEEQLHRFRHREDTDYKRHKINAEDWRNRRKWNAYEVAVGDMLALTDKPTAPWHLVPANNKRFARLQVLKLACEQISAALGAEKE